MKKPLLLLMCIGLFLEANAQEQQQKQNPPAFLIGNFTDDYQINYTISDSLWIQHPKTKYHIIKWNKEKQYVVARNDVGNKTDGNQYTRIDYMQFTGMEPFLWGFCLTNYNAATEKLAEETAAADRANPKKGCNGYPFSRMKRKE